MSFAAPGNADDGSGHRPKHDPLLHLRILTMEQLCELTTYTKQHIYRMQRAGTFPQRRQMGPNRVGVPLSEYEKWFASRPIVEPPDDDQSDE